MRVRVPRNASARIGLALLLLNELRGLLVVVGIVKAWLAAGAPGLH
jgi:hypothetical protein